MPLSRRCRGLTKRQPEDAAGRAGYAGIPLFDLPIILGVTSFSAYFRRHPHLPEVLSGGCRIRPCPFD